MWIRCLLYDGDSLRTIATKTGRSASVISREITPNARSSGVNDPHHADDTAEHRRKRPSSAKAPDRHGYPPGSASIYPEGSGLSAWPSG
ncbi:MULTISPECIES: helix-turn-helix domain-containing protein [unclassified Corynebacterium]|uniref:helix-turn-helix domain-containing protein n=1 Tax=unclassified Corynebacterium TaxID=2624378 RepID=UPI003F8EA3A3